MLNDTIARALAAHLDGIGLVSDDGQTTRFVPDAIDTFEGSPVELVRPVYDDYPSFEIAIGDEVFTITVKRSV